MSEEQQAPILPIMKRPWCCPEPRCGPIYQLKDSDYPNIAEPQPGESWSCFGAMNHPVIFNYDGVEHTNDLNSCHYSALKGVIRFQENEDDWQNLVAAYTRALMRLEIRNGETKCAEASEGIVSDVPVPVAAVIDG